MINSTAWRKTRRRKLEQSPLCEICKQNGVITAATEVHHVMPCETAKTVTDMRRLMFDMDNLQSLCHNCHSLIHTEMKSHSRVKVKENANRSLSRFKERFIL
nr:MAG TPA: HNH endonuclease [Caudoviricetes sp.]